MLGKLNHIAIAVPDIKAAAKQYKEIFGAKVSEVVEQPDHGVSTVFIDLGNIITHEENVTDVLIGGPIMSSVVSRFFETI